ncbi:MAG: hypothetical protein ACI9UK_000534 [Candidatus Krumholzibacteriia bacterium]|jgi:hypothetical protein
MRWHLSNTNTSYFQFRLHCLTQLTLAFVLAATGTSQAIAQDMLRVYWDSGLTQTFIETSSTPDTVTGYLVLEAPTVRGKVSFWQCYLATNGTGFEIFDIKLEGDGINNGQVADHLSVQVAKPFNVRKKTLLATFRVLANSQNLGSIRVGRRPSDPITRRPQYQTNQIPYPINFNLPWPLPEVAWLNGPEPIFYWQPAVVRFGNCLVKKTHQKTIRFTNLEGRVLHIDPQGLGDCSEFSFILPREGLDIPPGSHSDITIEFKPMTVEAVECRSAFLPNANVLITGAGREAVANLNYRSELSLPVTIIHGSSGRTFDIHNTGDLPVQLKPEFLNGDSPFSLSGETGVTRLPAGESHRLTVNFRPNEVGQMNSRLSIARDFPIIEISGSCRDSITIARAYPAELIMQTRILDRSIEAHIVIANEGDTPIRLTPTLNDTTATFRIISGGEALDLQAGEQRRIQIGFTPQAYGRFHASLSIYDQLKIPLQGTAAEKSLQGIVTPQSITFDNVRLGDSNTKSFIVRNVGLSILTVTVNSVGQPLNIGPTTADLEYGEEVAFHAAFVPGDFGEYSGNIYLGPRIPMVSWQGRTNTLIIPDTNRLGFFFDEALTQNELEIRPEPQLVTCYLALLNASNLSGIAGWECGLRSTQGSQFVGWEMEGNAVAAARNLEFAVGLGVEPLPWADRILLGTFKLAIFDTTLSDIDLELHPRIVSTIPGYMAWVPWDHPDALIPMVPDADSPVVARIRMSGTASDRQSLETLPIAQKDTPRMETALLMNWPNPFNPVTTIPFTMEKATDVKLRIFDATGRLIDVLVDAPYSAGRHEVKWHGRDRFGRSMPSGTYYVRLELPRKADHIKITLVR